MFAGKSSRIWHERVYTTSRRLQTTGTRHAGQGSRRDPRACWSHTLLEAETKMLVEGLRLWHGAPGHPHDSSAGATSTVPDSQCRIQDASSPASHAVKHPLPEPVISWATLKTSCFVLQETAVYHQSLKHLIRMSETLAVSRENKSKFKKKKQKKKVEITGY